MYLFYVKLQSLPEVMPKGPLLYEPIEPRCRSANPTKLDKDLPDERDTISLPGQLEGDLESVQIDLQPSLQKLTPANTIKTDKEIQDVRDTIIDLPGKPEEKQSVVQSIQTNAHESEFSFQSYIAVPVGNRNENYQALSTCTPDERDTLSLPGQLEGDIENVQSLQTQSLQNLTFAKHIETNKDVSDTYGLPGKLEEKQCDDNDVQKLQTITQESSEFSLENHGVQVTKCEDGKAISTFTPVQDEVKGNGGSSNVNAQLVYTEIQPRCKSAIQPKSESELDKGDTFSLPGQLDENQCHGRDVQSLQTSPKSPTEKDHSEQSTTLSSTQQSKIQSSLESGHDDHMVVMIDQSHMSCQAEKKEDKSLKATSNIDTDGQDILPADDDSHSYCLSEMSLSWAAIQDSGTQSITALGDHCTEEIVPSSLAQGNINQVHELPPLAEMRRLNWGRNRGCGYFAALFAYSVFALIMYPLLLFLLPFLLVSKLLCCLPCIKCYVGKQSQSTPLFFAHQKAGAYYVITTILKERLEPEAFVCACVSSLNDVYSDHDQRVFVLKLASILKKVACFLSWETQEKVQLDQHFVTLKQTITTNKDLSYLLGELSNKEKSGRLWMVYFLPLYKSNQSAVVIQVHHSITSGSDLKNTLFDLLQVSRPAETDLKDCSITKKPSALRAIIKAPGLLLKRLTLRSGPRLSGKPRFAFSSPIFLSQAYQSAKTANCSLDGLFLGCLTVAFRKYFAGRRKSLSNVTFAIPETYQSSSAYFVNLPVEKKYPIQKLLQKMDNQIMSKSEDAYILSLAGRLSTISLSRCITDMFARSAIKGATGIFVLIDCTSEPLFLEHHFVSSILAWPPLFHRFKMSVVILCYQNFFRICVATDKTECEWPEIFLNQFLSAFDDIYFCSTQ